MALGSVRRRVLFVAVCTALVASALAAGNAGAAPLVSPRVVLAPVVTVSPSHDLVDLQKVTMTGSGFGANAVVETIECPSGPFSITTCDLGTLVAGVADKHGGFTLRRYVRRLITAGFTTSHTVDCAAKAGCTLFALTSTNLAHPNGPAIFFNPKIPPKVPAMTVTPDTKLVDHQLVTVTGKNYAPSSSVTVSECVTGLPTTVNNGPPCDYATQRYVNVDGNGAFTAANVVLERRQLVFTQTSSRTVDCAASPDTCDLETAPGPSPFGSSSGSAKAPLSFDSTVPVIVASAHASTTSQLTDMQSITVTGSGFTPSATVTVQECTDTSSPFPTCDYNNTRSATAGFAGEFTLTFAVRREIGPVFSTSGLTNFDCATKPTSCDLSVQGTQSQAPATVALSFNPKVPAVPQTIAATPHTALHDNQNVTVSLHGFTPYQPVQIVECSAEAVTEHDNSTYCDTNTSQTATPTGPLTIQTAFPVHAVIGGQDGLVNCTTKPGACVLIATENSNSGIGTIVVGVVGSGQPALVSTPLTFAPH